MNINNINFDGCLNKRVTNALQSVNNSVFQEAMSRHYLNFVNNVASSYLEKLTPRG